MVGENLQEASINQYKIEEDPLFLNVSFEQTQELWRF